MFLLLYNITSPCISTPIYIFFHGLATVFQNFPTTIELPTDQSTRRPGRRSVLLAVLAATIVVYTIFSFSSHSESASNLLYGFATQASSSETSPIPSSTPSSTTPLSSDHFRDNTASATSLDSSSGSSSTHSTQVTPESSERPSCSLIKASMLYGAHKFAQLEQALEMHRRHSERWGCESRNLEQSLSGRKLYSKQYFLLSLLLLELSKPAEDRKQWVMQVSCESSYLFFSNMSRTVGGLMRTRYRSTRPSLRVPSCLRTTCRMCML
jgi:hypothetical protein